MILRYPSAEFDDAVAAVCHGLASDEQVRCLNEVLRTDAAARDEYILRIEIHSRLASDPDLFLTGAREPSVGLNDREMGLLRELASASPATPRSAWARNGLWMLAAASLAALMAMGAWKWRVAEPTARPAATSQAVAMLNQTVDAHWGATRAPPRLGAPLDPGWLKLEAGLAQIVFYSGARIVVEGPAEIQLVSPGHVACRAGKITADVPPEARGFRLDTPQGIVTDLGTAFGVEVSNEGTKLDVFKGAVTLQTAAQRAVQTLREGVGAVIDQMNVFRFIAADPAAYSSLLNLRERSLAADALRLERWRAAGELLNRDATLKVRFDFEHAGSSSWELHNVAQAGAGIYDATIVGCQFGKGRWPEKRALEFQSVSDRVRMTVPGEFGAVTLAAWVRVQGLDRKLNSLFMSDGFSTGTLHWLIRDDGVLSLTIVGPRSGEYQLVLSPPVVTLDKLGMWIHLAVTVDGRTGRAVHYLNGQPVANVAMQFPPPYLVGTAELGNWNGKGFPENDPNMIRNFSGAMDDFCLFGRALDAREIQALYAEGKPDLDAVALPEWQ